MKTITAVLLAIVVSLGMVQRAAEPSPAQRPPHWVNVPSNLRQMNDDGTELHMLGVAATRNVWLGASSRSQPFNDCDWWYRIEIEIRKAGESFTYKPTHIGDWIPRSFSNEPLAYPLVQVDDLEPHARYRWIARERVQPFTQRFDPDQERRCEPGAFRDSAWVWHHVPLDFSFRTR